MSTVPNLPFIETIVHPTDFSAASEHAFAHALAVALLRRAHLTLLHVGAATGMPQGRTEDGAGWRFNRLLRDGDPVEQILAVADELQADLIVMPTEGRTGAFDALRGSTTERVLRRAPCPLLAVPAAAH